MRFQVGKHARFTVSFRFRFFQSTGTTWLNLSLFDFCCNTTENEIEMTDEHWKVVDYLQEQHKNEVALSVRKVGKSGVVSIKEFYALFPGGPLKISTMIAGIPKPKSCI